METAVILASRVAVRIRDVIWDSCLIIRGLENCLRMRQCFSSMPFCGPLSHPVYETESSVIGTSPLGLNIFHLFPQVHPFINLNLL